MTPLLHLLVMLTTPLAPLAIASALLLKRDSRALQATAMLAPLPALLTSLLVPPGIAATLPWLLEGSELGLDEIGRVFLFFSAVIWIAAGVHAQATMRRDGRGTFQVFFLLAMAGNLGLLVARDMLSFYLFFSLMSFAVYGLVVHDGEPAARRAGAIYMVLVVAGDMMLYAALVPAALDAGGSVLLAEVRDAVADSPRRDMIVALLLAGFGVKAGLIGLHFALPLIYRAAPLPAGAVLAGAMLHAGLLGWLRFLPLDAGLAAWGGVLIVLGLAGAFYGVLVGCLQRNPFALLGYSSISQMGIMLAAVGAALGAAAPAGTVVLAVTVYALHHAFAKTALFLGVGLAAHAPAAGLPRAAVLFGLVWPSAALVGVPLTSGMLAKEVLKEEIQGTGAAWASGLADLLPWTAFGTALLVARLLWLSWPPHAGARGVGTGEVPAGAVLPWIAVLSMSVFAVWLLPIDEVPDLWRAGVLWELSWPALAAAAAVGFAAVLVPRLIGRLPELPPGDAALAFARLGRPSRAAWSKFVTGPLPHARNALRDSSTELLRDRRWAAAFGVAEGLLGRWAVAIGLFVVAALAFSLVMLGA